jgi:hypothetical protein
MKNSEGGTDMRIKTSGVCIMMALFLLGVTSPALSFSICYQASKGLTQSNEAFMQYFNSSLKNQKSEPEYVRVLDVSRAQSNSGYSVVFDCGNNVLLNVTSGSEFLKDLKEKQEVVFSGEAQDWKKNRYQDSKKEYIEITMGIGFVNFQELDRVPAKRQ